MDAGSTFLLTQVDKHLWVVLSSPNIDPQKVLLASLTTASRFKEDVCLIESGEHPWVRHRTCVSYESDHSRVITLENIHKLKDGGYLKFQEPLSPPLFKRVIAGAAASKRIPLEYLEILISQGFIEG